MRLEPEEENTAFCHCLTLTAFTDLVGRMRQKVPDTHHCQPLRSSLPTLHTQCLTPVNGRFFREKRIRTQQVQRTARMVTCLFFRQMAVNAQPPTVLAVYLTSSHCTPPTPLLPPPVMFYSESLSLSRTYRMPCMHQRSSRPCVVLELPLCLQ